MCPTVSSIADCCCLVLDADYTTALSLLLHYSLPPSPDGTAGLVKDAEYLDHNRSSEAGASVVERYSGRRPGSQAGKKPSSGKGGLTGLASDARRQERRHIQPALSPSPNRLSASLLSQQRGLEALFQDVSGEVQRRTEGWSIAKAVKGAVGEVKRNVQNLQQETSARKDIIARQARDQEPDTNDHQIVAQSIQELQERNNVLAKMLGTALESLRELKEGAIDDKERVNDESFDIILAKLQFVQVYLADPDIPIPTEVPEGVGNHGKDQVKKKVSGEVTPVTDKLSWSKELTNSTRATSEERRPAVRLHEVMPARKTNSNLDGKAIPHTDLPPTRQQRPSLAESSFSFMLGEGRHRSSFVSSVSAPPEQRRGSDPKSKPKQPVVGDREIAAKGTESEDDGFTMSSLRGFERR
jgi:TBC1 domain family protein 5